MHIRSHRMQADHCQPATCPLFTEQYGAGAADCGVVWRVGGVQWGIEGHEGLPGPSGGGKKGGKCVHHTDKKRLTVTNCYPPNAVCYSPTTAGYPPTWHSP